VVEALWDLGRLRGVVEKPRALADRAQGLVVHRGDPPPADLTVVEHGVRFRVDLARVQKTGLFLDHRENRRFVGGLARGRRVLNLFCYTGGFSLFAARGGAREVVSVDSAAPAMAATRDNFALNGCRQTTTWR
jgi:23S rRNA (cytosine1962-C5)-methyltransferase